MNEDMLNVMGSFISTELDAFENLHKELEGKGICNPNTGILYMPKSQNQIAKELGISKNHLSNILNGKRTCSNELSSKILSYYPDLKFVLYKPRWIVEKVEE